MKVVRPPLGIHVPAALFVAAIFSTSVAAAEFSPNSAAWPRGDGWIIQVDPQGALPMIGKYRIHRSCRTGSCRRP